MKSIAPVMLVVFAFAASCGTDGGQGDIAKAFDQAPKKDPAAAKSADAMKALREKAEREAQEAREAEVVKLTSIAAPLPGSVEVACAAAAEGFDAFHQARLAGDETALGRWNATKEPDIRAFVEACATSTKVEVGACMAHALNDASPALFAESAADELVERCKTRWGAPAEVVAHESAG